MMARTKEATCTEDGVKDLYMYCMWRDKDRSNPGCRTSVWRLTVTKEATATEKGEESRTCAACGKVETREIPAKGEETEQYG